jgi:hypothetical protein
MPLRGVRDRTAWTVRLGVEAGGTTPAVPCFGVFGVRDVLLSPCLRFLPMLGPLRFLVFFPSSGGGSPASAGGSSAGDGSSMVGGVGE